MQVHFLVVSDSTANSLTGAVQSTGGNSGDSVNYSFAGHGGSATSFIALTSTKNGINVSSTASATGGSGGINRCGVGIPSFGGAATATASASAWALALRLLTRQQPD